MVNCQHTDEITKLQIDALIEAGQSCIEVFRHYTLGDVQELPAVLSDVWYQGEQLQLLAEDLKYE